MSIPGNEKFRDNPDEIEIGDKLNLVAPADPAQSPVNPPEAAPEEAKQPEASAGEPKQPEAATEATDQPEASPEEQKTEEQKQPEAAEEAPASQEEKDAEAATYEIKHGDTLSDIAKARGTTEEWLLSLEGNEKFWDNPDKINAGEKLNVVTTFIRPLTDFPFVHSQMISPNPLPTTSHSVVFVAPLMPDPPPIAEPRSPHSVFINPHMFEPLPITNLLAPPTDLSPLTNLSLTTGGASLGASKAEDYTIEKGDTLSAIAQEHGTTVSALAADNDISNPDHIEAGAHISLAGESD